VRLGDAGLTPEMHWLAVAQGDALLGWGEGERLVVPMPAGSAASSMALDVYAMHRRHIGLDTKLVCTVRAGAVVSLVKVDVCCAESSSSVPTAAPAAAAPASKPNGKAGTLDRYLQPVPSSSHNSDAAPGKRCKTAPGPRPIAVQPAAATSKAPVRSSWPALSPMPQQPPAPPTHPANDNPFAQYAYRPLHAQHDEPQSERAMPRASALVGEPATVPPLVPALLKKPAVQSFEDIFGL